jgi:hypothetical protein
MRSAVCSTSAAYDFLDSVRASDRRFVAELAHQDDKITFAAHCFPELLHIHDPCIDGIGTTIDHTFRQIRRQAIDINQGFTRLDDGLGHRSGGRSIHWTDHDSIHSLGEEMFDLALLLRGVVGCIDDREFDIRVLLAPLGHGVSDIGQPHIVKQSHGHTNSDLLIRLGRHAAQRNRHQSNNGKEDFEKSHFLAPMVLVNIELQQRLIFIGSRKLKNR